MTAAAIRIAAFDVDGTLVAGQLSGRLPAMLVDAGLVSRDRWARLRDDVAGLARGGLEDPANVTRLFGLYAAMLRGVSCDAADRVARELWADRRREIFAFARPLLADLRAAGIEPMLISGGVHELLALAAADLGIERYQGLRATTSRGVYAGDVEPSSLRPKHETAEALAGGRPICWARSLAVGDSLRDAGLLQRVGHPFAFEPSPALGDRARERAWPIVDRDTLAPLLRSRLRLAPRRSPARADELPVALDAARRRLRDRLATRLDGSGAIGGACESRIVESSLMLTLLRREQLLPTMQDGLKAFLRDRAPGAAPFDAAMIDAVLRAVRVRDGDAVIERTLMTTDHHGLVRKRLTLTALLAVAGAAPFSRHVAAAACEAQVEAPWTRLVMQAVRVLHHSQDGTIEGSGLRELVVMLEAARRRGVFEKHLLAHLMALLALNRARPGHDLIREGVAQLAAHQNPDGGMPFVVSADLFATATGGLALAAANADGSMLTAVGEVLTRHQRADGGWPFARDVTQSDADTTAYAVRCLAALDPAANSVAIGRGRAFLRAIAAPDGGFPTFLAGQRSEPAMTAGAICALVPCGLSDRSLIAAAAGFLLAAQRPDGTFGRGWSLAESAGIFLGVAAMSAARDASLAPGGSRADASIDAALRRLLCTAQPGGGWGQTPARPSDPISTAYSLMALAGTHTSSLEVRAGAGYLLSRQCADGGYVSPPDQSGPRPLPYSIPALADIFVLLAMARLSTAMSDRPWPPRPR